MKKRLLAMLLAVVMVAALLPTAFAADEPSISVTVTKTDIKADRAANSGGYGCLRINGNWDDEKYKGWILKYDEAPAGLVNPQVALVDRNGKLILPYRENTDIYQRTLDYTYHDGVVSLAFMYTDNYGVYMNDGFAEYYLTDGTKISGKTYAGGGVMYEGYAVVIESGSGTINGYEGEPVYKILDKNGKVNELPEEFSTQIGGGGIYNYWNQLMIYPPRCGEGLFAYYEGWSGEAAGYIDTTGKTVLNLEGRGYYFPGPFSNGLAWVADEDETYGYIDKAGKLVIPHTYDTVSIFDSNGLALVEKDGKWGFIDKTGKVVIPLTYDSASTSFKDGLVYVQSGGKYGYIDKTGKTVIPFEYDGAYGAGNGLAAVVKNGKCGLVDYNNNVVVPLEYDDISSFVDGVAYAVKGGYLYIITEAEKSEEPEKPEENEPSGVTFTDVSQGDWFYENVRWAAEKGYIKGNDGKFSPDAPLTRGAIWTILARVDGTDTDGGSSWYQKGLDWAVAHNVSDGSNPGGEITLEQLIVMLYRYMDSPEADTSVLDRFSDSSAIHTWDGFPEAIAWAVESGLLQGGSDGKLDPLSNLARSRGAVVLQRYCEKLDK